MSASPSASSPIFSAARFVCLLRHQARTHARAWAVYVLVTTVVLGLLALVSLGATSHALKTTAQIAWFVMGLLFSGYLFAHHVLGVWRSHPVALGYLMLPASTWEKWLFCALLLLVAWPLVYMLLFALVFGPAGQLGYQINLQEYQQALLSSSSGPADQMPLPKDFAPFGPWLDSFWRAQMRPVWLGYVMLTGYAAATLTWFRRHAGMYALMLGVVLGVCTIGLITLGEPSGVLFWWLGITDASMDGALAKGDAGSVSGALYTRWAAQALGAVFWLGVPALLWAASWRALREKDLLS